MTLPHNPSSSLGLARWLQVAGVLAMTLGSLLWALWGMDLRALWGAVAHFRFVLLAPMLGVFLVSVAARVWRFQLLLERPVPFRSLFPVVAVSVLAIAVIPLRMGELVRPYLLQETRGVPFASALAAVIVERVLDLAALLVLLLGIAFVVRLPEQGMRMGGVDLLAAGRWVSGTSVVVALLGALLIGAVGDAATSKATRLVARVHPGAAAWFAGLLSHFVQAFRAMVRRPMHAFGAMLCTGLFWLTNIASFFIPLFGFAGMDATVDRAAFAWLTSTVTATLGPTPGSVGSFHAGCVGALLITGTDEATAQTFAVLLHATTFVFIAGLGAVFLVLEGWSLTEVVRRSRSLG